MELQIGTRYQCRRKGYIACVTDDVSTNDKLYKYKGYVVDANTGIFVRKICMWTATGIYNVDHPTDYDIISISKGVVSNSCLICGKELDKETAEHGNGTCSEYCNAKYSGYPMPSDYSEGLQIITSGSF